MRYASEIVGLPIVDFATGEKFEKVNDIVFDDQQNQVLALLTDLEGVFSGARIIAWDDVQSVGVDAVIVATKDVEVKAESNQVVEQAIKKDKSVKGKTVMTEDGKDLGNVADLQIDETTGRVVAYKTSGGIFADAYRGQPIVPAPMTLKVGEQVVFVPNETVQLMEQQSGGIKGAAQSVAETAGDLKDQAVAKTQDFSEAARAKSLDLKDQAVDAYGNAKDQAQSPEMRDRVDSAKESAHSTMDVAKDKVANVWDQVKERATDLKNQAEDSMEERRIKAALGRPTNRVILDRADGIILNTGDLITNEAIAKARQAGVLDVLLSSVHSEGPSLTTEDMKAHQPQPEDGSAAGHI